MVAISSLTFVSSKALVCLRAYQNSKYHLDASGTCLLQSISKLHLVSAVLKVSKVKMYSTR